MSSSHLAVGGDQNRLKPELRTRLHGCLQGSEFRLQAAGSQNGNRCHMSGWDMTLECYFNEASVIPSLRKRVASTLGT